MEILIPVAEEPSDHERVVGSGAWLGTLAASAGLCWVDAQVPWLAGWALNTTVIMAAAGGMAWWKRAWYGWLAFGGWAPAAPPPPSPGC